MKTIRQMTVEVRECNRAKGWLDNENTWGELLALLHSEISEMVGAYRKWRLVDGTTDGKPIYGEEDGMGNPVVIGYERKPEGVGAECADTLIRLLSMYDIFKIPVFDGDCELADVATLPDVEREEDLQETFGDWVAWLHRKADTLWESPTWQGPIFLRALVTFAERWDINLATEYERKHAHNLTREVKHGGTISDRPVNA